MKNPPVVDVVRAVGGPSTQPPPARPWGLVGVALAALVGTIVGGAFLLKTNKETTPVAQPTVATATPLPEATIPRAQLTNFGALPEAITTPDNPLTEPKIALGRMLFYDKRLSKNDDVSCNHCHTLDKHGVDGKRVSTGTGSQPGHRNSPSVYNAAGGVTLMWDGRATSVEAQAWLPLNNPKEHGLTEEEVVKRLSAIAGYREAFAKAFPDARPAITAENVGKAIGAFERKLVTPSRWDAFVGGDADQLTSEEKRGFNLFFSVGCPTCHVGPYLGMSMNQKLGLMHAWPGSTDRGRFEETKRPEDMMVFRVPSLRNVVDTGPYLHDGSIAKLDEVVRMMAYHQLGKKIPEDDVKAIVAWLSSLSGKIPAEYIAPPTLPASGDTPKGDLR